MASAAKVADDMGWRIAVPILRPRKTSLGFRYRISSSASGPSSHSRFTGRTDATLDLAVCKSAITRGGKRHDENGYERPDAMLALRRNYVLARTRRRGPLRDLPAVARPLAHQGAPARDCRGGHAAAPGHASNPARVQRRRERRRENGCHCRRAGEDFGGYSDSSADAVADSFAEATLGLDVGPAAAMSARFCRLTSALRGPIRRVAAGLRFASAPTQQHESSSLVCCDAPG